MGSSFSVGPLPKVLDECVGMMEIQDVKYMLLKHVRQSGEKSPLFLKIHDVQKILKLDPVKAFKVMRILDRNNSGFLNYVDFWGGLAMVVRSSPDEKVAFCFELMDVNEDKHMYPHEVFTLMRCITRAVANIKGNKYVPLESIADLFKQIMKSKNIKLTESGEMSMYEFRSFLIASDSSRIYLTNLGSQVTTENKLKLLDNRNDLLNNIESLNIEIDLLEKELMYKTIDKECFSKERGGDIELLTLEQLQHLGDSSRPATGNGTLGRNSEIDNNKKAIEQLNAAMAELAAAQGYLDNLAVRNVNDVQDGLAFDLATMSSGSTSRNSNLAQKNNARDASLIFFWKKSAIDQDGLVVCDDKFINQICNVIGLELKPNEKADCLKYISEQRTQLNRSHYQSMINWLKDVYFFMSQTSFETLDSFSAFCQHCWFGFLHWSDSIILSLNNEYQLCQEFEKYMRGDLLYASTSATAKLQGYQALATWQRVRQAAVLCKLRVSCEFGNRPKPPPSVVKGDKTGKQKSSKFEASKFEFASKCKGIDININGQYKSKLDFRAQSSSDHITVSMAEFKAFDNRQIAELGLNALRKDHPDQKFSLDMYPCLQWVSINLKEATTLPEAKCLLIVFKRALNYFKAWVDGYFPQITGNVISILPEEEEVPEEDKKKKKGTSSFGDSLLKAKIEKENKFASTEGGPFDPNATLNGEGEEAQKAEKKTTQTILIVMFSNINFVEEIEKQLPPGLLITRLFKTFSFKMQLDQTFAELLETMIRSNNGAQRMFGPQEDEIPEDMKNPINFMAAQKQLHKDLVFKIKNPEKVNMDELDSLLETHGYKREGSLDEKNRRVNRLLRNYLNMVLGGGQLSTFGKTITQKLFNIGSKGTGKIGFWALNEYIDKFDSKTLFDQREFLDLMDTEAIQTQQGDERKAFITKNGFDSYYERLGQLTGDSAKLRLGSLDELLSGITQLQCEYDADAVMSMFSLIDNTSYTWTKELLNYFLLGINRNTATELRTSSLHDFIKRLLDSELSFLSSPDGFVQALEDFQSMFANGDQGFIPSLRNYCKNTFGKYFDWEEPFVDFWHKLKEHEVEKYEQEAMAAEATGESAAEGGEGESGAAAKGGSRPATGKTDHTERTGEEEIMAATGGFADYLERFRECLPPEVKANSYRRQSKVIDKERAFLLHMLEHESDRLSRNDIEDIKRILEQIDGEFAILVDEKMTLERSMFAYCLCLYDIFRLFCSEFCTFGIGFEEFTISGHVSGLLFNNIPWGVDDPNLESNAGAKGADAAARARNKSMASTAEKGRNSSKGGDSDDYAAQGARARGRTASNFPDRDAKDKDEAPEAPPPFTYNLFLKGDGDRPATQQFLIDKLARSVHRKQNALAFLRKQRMKKQEELDGATRSEEKKDEDEMYEYQLLSEIQEISKNDTSSMERYSKAQFKRLSRKWEEFGQFYMQNNQSPIKLCISLSNSAVASIMAREEESALQNLDILEVAANTIHETFIGEEFDISTLTTKDFTNPQIFTTYFLLKNYISVLNANKMSIPKFVQDFYDVSTPMVLPMPQFRDCTIVQCFPGFFVYLLPWVKDISETGSLASEDVDDDDMSMSKDSGVISKSTKGSKKTKVSRASTVEKIEKIKQRRDLYDLIASNEISKIFQNVAAGKTDVAEFSKFVAKKGHSKSHGHDDASTINSKAQSFDQSTLNEAKNRQVEELDND